MESCNLCENPYPFMCSECHDFQEVALKEEKEISIFKFLDGRKYIGSGEDLIPELV